MSKTKEERIKKLKKNRIWPSVLGLIFILFVFSIVMLAALGLSGMDIVRRKLTDSSRMSVKVAEVFAGYGEENKEIIEQTVVSHIHVLDEVEAVAVVNSEGQFLWSSNGEYPVLDHTIKMELLPGLMEDEVRVIIADQQDQVFVIEDGEIVFNQSALADIFLKPGFNTKSPFSELKLWMIIPAEDLDVLVLNRIPVYFQDFVMMGICIALCGLLIAIFVIYYLISMISMVSGIRKTTKIIYTDMVTGGDNWLLFIKKGTGLLKKNRKGKRNYAMIHLEMRKYRSFCTCFGVKKGQELIEKFYFALRKS